MKRYKQTILPLALLAATLLPLTGCGVAATIALTKAQCESQGNYWDEVEGCRPQETAPATDTTTTDTTTTTGAASAA